MPEQKVMAIPNITTPNTPVIFNKDICNGCNHCVEVCQIDVYIPHPEKIGHKSNVFLGRRPR